MTGAPPYNAQSPTQQQQRLPAYESPSKNRQYYPNGEQNQQQHFSQPPPQTPPAFAPTSIARSPHYSHASPSVPGQLPPPPLNGAAPPPPGPNSQYQGPPTGGNSHLYPRPFPSSVAPGSNASPYGPSTPHGHHSVHPPRHSQSPSRDADSPYRARDNGHGYATSVAREPRPASPPRESVRTR